MLMGYLKFKADRIFDGYRMIEDHILVIHDDGTVEGLVPESGAGSGIRQVNGLLSPGLINCHCHLELSHMKGRIPERTGLVDFVFKVVTERNHPQEEILDSIEKAEEEMCRNGIVAVGDICNNTLTLQQKMKGNLHYYNFIEASGWLPQLAPNRFERAASIYQTYREAGDPFSPGNLMFTSIVPHAPYSVSEPLWQKIRPFFRDRVVSIHNQETAFEDEFFSSGTGDFNRMYQMMNLDNSHHQPSQKTSLQSYFDKLYGARNAIFVHNTFTGKVDIDFMHGRMAGDKIEEAIPSLYFCLCANANQYIENAMPPVHLLRNSKIPLVLGTDSLASNWSLDIMSEIKTILEAFPGISWEEILKWATINGAQALDMSGELGSFEKGKRPGVILIDQGSYSASRVI